jgi:hypothetical protein
MLLEGFYFSIYKECNLHSNKSIIECKLSFIYLKGSKGSLTLQQSVSVHYVETGYIFVKWLKGPTQSIDSYNIINL